MSYHDLTSLPPSLSALHCLHLTWAQWTDVLTHNITARNIKNVHLVRHAGDVDQVEDLKIPYQILGESLATASVLTLRGYRVSSQQVRQVQAETFIRSSV